MIYSVLGLVVVLIILGFLAYRYYHKYSIVRQKYISHRNKCVQETALLKSQTVTQSIHKSLCTMDETYNTYRDEDEANRELTTCLNLLGHKAFYHYPLGNGRTADIMIDQYALIEGKLDIDQAEADRLIGQIEDYLSYCDKIYVVLYGDAPQNIIDRLSVQLVAHFPNKVTLIYLNEAKRVRGGEVNEVHYVHKSSASNRYPDLSGNIVRV